MCILLVVYIYEIKICALSIYLENLAYDENGEEQSMTIQIKLFLYFSRYHITVLFCCSVGNSIYLVHLHATILTTTAIKMSKYLWHFIKWEYCQTGCLSSKENELYIYNNFFINRYVIQVIPKQTACIFEPHAHKFDDHSQYLSYWHYIC